MFDAMSQTFINQSSRSRTISSPVRAQVAHSRSQVALRYRHGVFGAAALHTPKPNLATSTGASRRLQFTHSTQRTIPMVRNPRKRP